MKKEFVLVGGYVRDKLLGLEPSDRDFLAVGYSQEEMIKAGFKRVGMHFPVFLHPETNEEYALPRKEISTGNGYKEFTFITDNVSIEEDLKRRDLTINAMAMRDNGEIIDPFGGRKDLENGILRHTSEAFVEDPLRVLRLARFKAKFPTFTIAPETVELVQSLREHLKVLTPFRVFLEIQKALKLNNPHVFFITLRDLGVLDIVMPELHDMTQIYHNNKYHKEGSVFNHSMLVLYEAAKLSKDPVVRFGALFHDVGKLLAYDTVEKLKIHSSKKYLVPIFRKMKYRYSLSNEYHDFALKCAIFYHRLHDWNIMKPSTKVRLITRKDFASSVEELEKMLLVADADSFGRIIDISETGDSEVVKDIYECIKIMECDKKVNGLIGGNRVMKKHDRKILKEFEAVKGVKLNSEEAQNNIERVKQILHKKRITAILKQQ